MQTTLRSSMRVISVSLREMKVDDIISYHDMLTVEKASLQKGMK